VNEDHWFNVVYHPLQEPDGEVTGIIAVLTEATLQVRARMELERANRELEEFAYASSHDLQEPLRMVSIYSQLLLEQVPTDAGDARLFAGFVRDGVARMESLIKDLLTYSRIVHPEQEEARAADLNESLEEALTVLRVRIEETGASIVSDPLPHAVAEPRQLALVFQNLLSNALKYCQPEAKPEIRIEATELDHQWVVCTKKTKASASIRSMRSASLACLNGFTKAPIPERAWGSPFVSHRRALWRPDLGHQPRRRARLRVFVFLA
jgi:light-regulated signal transduction histidine kinase (bacteriophytochrome)